MPRMQPGKCRVLLKIQGSGRNDVRIGLSDLMVSFMIRVFPCKRVAEVQLIPLKNSWDFPVFTFC